MPWAATVAVACFYAAVHAAGAQGGCGVGRDFGALLGEGAVSGWGGGSHGLSRLACMVEDETAFEHDLFYASVASR